LQIRQIAWFLIAAIILVYAIGYRSVDITKKVSTVPACEQTSRELASEVLKRLIEEFAIQPDEQKIYLDEYSSYFCSCLKEESDEKESDSLDDGQSAQLIKKCSIEAGKFAGEKIKSHSLNREAPQPENEN
jgi:hypothetical protein